MRAGETIEEAVTAARSAAESAGREAREASGWDAAVAAWDRVVALLPGGLERDAQAIALDFAARIRLRRAWSDGPPSDLEVAVGLWRRAREVVTPTFGDRAAMLNNLGVALRALWERDGFDPVLDEAVAAGEEAAGASSADSLVGAAARLQLAKSLRLRFRDRRHPGDVDRAIAVLSEATEPADDAQRGEWHETLGNACYDRFAFAGARADREAAAAHLRRALEHADETDAPAYAANLASVLLDRFELEGDRSNLDEALALLTSAVDSVGGESRASGDLLSNLANALRLRATSEGSVDDVDRAAALLERGVDAEPAGSRRVGMLSNLAGALLERYDLAAQIADLETAVELLQEAVATTPAGDPDIRARLSNLAIALRNRQLRRRRGRGDLDRAVAAFEQALASTPDSAPDAAALHANLGNVLHQRFDVIRARGDLDRAVRELETALEHTPESSRDRPGYLNNLAATLAARAAEIEGPRDDLERAVAAAREAVELCPPGSPQRTTYLVNLGNALSERFARSGNAGDLDAGRDAYRIAARAGLATAPAEAFAAAHNWSEWARDREEWAEVAEAYACGEQAIRAMFRAQLSRADKESWLRDVEDLVVDGAFALAAADDPRGAAVALERGRALLLSEALERAEADLSRLEEGHAGLAIRFRESSARVRRLELSAARV
jgi:tetratricopeptide (TPR) repeat protein